MTLLDKASLIVTPNAYKSGTLYSVIPSDGSGDMTFSRASTGTRVNSQGLVEVVPYNLLQYTEDFNDAYWTKQNGSLTSNTTTAPNGTLTADTYTSNGGTTIADKSCLVRANIIPSDGIYTRSVYMKKGNTRYAWLSTFSTAFTDGNFFVFDFDTASISFTNNLSNRNIELKVENAGNGWYRFIYVQDSLTSGITYNISFGMSNASNSMENHNNGDFVYVWGAQLVEGTQAKDYFPIGSTRNNFPRLDYSNGSCPSLLLEPQRTNLLLWSEDFENSYWYEEPGNTVTSNATTSPSGIQNADTFTATAGNEMNVHNYAAFALGSGTFTYSIYLKNNGTNLISVYLFKIGSGFAARGEINFSAKTFTASIGTGTIQELENGWFRVMLTNSVTAGDFTTGVYLTDTTGTRSVYTWGAQLEAGSYATSYIPTTSASVTRVSDVCSKTGISSLIGQTEGTLFADIVYNGAANTGQYNRIINITDGTTNNFISIAKNNTTSELYIYSETTSGIQVNSLPITGTNIIGRHKIALAYKANDFVLYFDGAQVFSDTSAAVAACNTLNIGRIIPGDEFGGSYNSAILFKERLTNDELQSLTTI